MCRLVISVCCLLVLNVVELSGEEGLNLRPIVGILTQPSLYHLEQYGPNYVAASYVKYIEAAGARAVPVHHDAPEHELRKAFDHLNGILFPGGDSSTDNTTLYQTGQLFYNWALEAFDQGDYFPIVGHCLGFEMLLKITSQNFTILQSTDAQNISLPLHFTSDAQNSRMFGNAPERILDILSSDPVTLNNHIWGLYPSVYKDTPSLNTFYSPLSTNYDKEGVEFISTIEGIKYPVFGIQWHAEKPLFEWNPDEAINHSPNAIVSMQYMADFTVSQARLSKHHYPFEKEAQRQVFYRDEPIYTFNDEKSFEQCYFFNVSGN